jgi:hypothetical protein
VMVGSELFSGPDLVETSLIKFFYSVSVYT